MHFSQGATLVALASSALARPQGPIWGFFEHQERPETNTQVSQSTDITTAPQQTATPHKQHGAYEYGWNSADPGRLAPIEVDLDGYSIKIDPSLEVSDDIDGSKPSASHYLHTLPDFQPLTSSIVSIVDPGINNDPKLSQTPSSKPSDKMPGFIPGRSSYFFHGHYTTAVPILVASKHRDSPLHQTSTKAEFISLPALSTMKLGPGPMVDSTHFSGKSYPTSLSAHETLKGPSNVPTGSVLLAPVLSSLHSGPGPVVLPTKSTRESESVKTDLSTSASVHSTKQGFHHYRGQQSQSHHSQSTLSTVNLPLPTRSSAYTHSTPMGQSSHFSISPAPLPRTDSLFSSKSSAVQSQLPVHASKGMISSKNTGSKTSFPEKPTFPPVSKDSSKPSPTQKFSIVSSGFSHNESAISSKVPLRHSALPFLLLSITKVSSDNGQRHSTGNAPHPTLTSSAVPSSSIRSQVPSSALSDTADGHTSTFLHTLPSPPWSSGIIESYLSNRASSILSRHSMVIPLSVPGLPDQGLPSSANPIVDSHGTYTTTKAKSQTAQHPQASATQSAGLPVTASSVTQSPAGTEKMSNKTTSFSVRYTGHGNSRHTSASRSSGASVVPSSEPFADMTSSFVLPLSSAIATSSTSLAESLGSHTSLQQILNSSHTSLQQILNTKSATRSLTQSVLDRASSATSSSPSSIESQISAVKSSHLMGGESILQTYHSHSTTPKSQNSSPSSSKAGASRTASAKSHSFAPNSNTQTPSSQASAFTMSQQFFTTSVQSYESSTKPASSVISRASSTGTEFTPSPVSRKPKSILSSIKSAENSIVSEISVLRSSAASVSSIRSLESSVISRFAITSEPSSSGEVVDTISYITSKIRGIPTVIPVHITGQVTEGKRRPNMLGMASRFPQSTMSGGSVPETQETTSSTFLTDISSTMTTATHASKAQPSKTRQTSRTEHTSPARHASASSLASKGTGFLTSSQFTDDDSSITLPTSLTTNTSSTLSTASTSHSQAHSGRPSSPVVGVSSTGSVSSSKVSNSAPETHASSTVTLLGPSDPRHSSASLKGHGLPQTVSVGASKGATNTLPSLSSVLRSPIVSLTRSSTSSSHSSGALEISSVRVSTFRHSGVSTEIPSSTLTTSVDSAISTRLPSILSDTRNAHSSASSIPFSRLSQKGSSSSQLSSAVTSEISLTSNVLGSHSTVTVPMFEPGRASTQRSVNLVSSSQPVPSSLVKSIFVPSASVLNSLTALTKGHVSSSGLPQHGASFPHSSYSAPPITSPISDKPSKRPHTVSSTTKSSSKFGSLVVSSETPAISQGVDDPTKYSHTQSSLLSSPSVIMATSFSSGMDTKPITPTHRRHSSESIVSHTVVSGSTRPSKAALRPTFFAPDPISKNGTSTSIPEGLFTSKNSSYTSSVPTLTMQTSPIVPTPTKVPTGVKPGGSEHGNGEHRQGEHSPEDWDHGKPHGRPHGHEIVDLEYDFNFYNGETYDDTSTYTFAQRNEERIINSVLPFKIQEDFNKNRTTYYDPGYGDFYYLKVCTYDSCQIAQVARNCDCYKSGNNQKIRYLVPSTDKQSLQQSEWNSEALLPAATRRRVKAGDNLQDIADKYGVSLPELIRTNPGIKNPDVIWAGQTVNIPAQAYTIKKGDSLESISQLLNIGMVALERLNPQLEDPNYLVPSELLRVPASKLGEPFLYTVEPRETLWSIARKFEIALADLEKANDQILDKTNISVGQMIKIPIYLPSQGDVTFEEKCTACEKGAAPTGAKFAMASPTLTTIQVGPSNKPIVAEVPAGRKISKGNKARGWF